MGRRELQRLAEGAGTRNEEELAATLPGPCTLCEECKSPFNSAACLSFLYWVAMQRAMCPRCRLCELGNTWLLLALLRVPLGIQEDVVA